VVNVSDGVDTSEAAFTWTVRAPRSLSGDAHFEPTRERLRSQLRAYRPAVRPGLAYRTRVASETLLPVAPAEARRAPGRAATGARALDPALAGRVVDSLAVEPRRPPREAAALDHALDEKLRICRRDRRPRLGVELLAQIRRHGFGQRESLCFTGPGRADPPSSRALRRI
jgi:hypothetical protein